MRSRTRWLVAAVALSACGDPFAPEPQPVSATIQALPRGSGPVGVSRAVSIVGGDRIQIRFVLDPCGEPIISASRIRSEITVDVGSPPQICLAISAPSPYLAELHDLRSGRYRVHVRSLGGSRLASAFVTVD